MTAACGRFKWPSTSQRPRLELDALAIIYIDCQYTAEKNNSRTVLRIFKISHEEKGILAKRLQCRDPRAEDPRR
jgi:hypothetical protein